MNTKKTEIAARVSMIGQALALSKDIIYRYGWKLIALVLLMVVVGLTEGLGMILFIPLLDAVGIGDKNDSSVIGRFLDTALSYTGVDQSLSALVAVLSSVFVAQFILYVFQSWWFSSIHRDYGAIWQKQMFESFIYANTGFLSQQKLGNMSNLIAVEAGRIGGAFNIFIQIATLLVTTLIYLVLASLISWRITLLIISFAIVLFITATSLSKKSFEIGKKIGPAASRLNVLLTEFLGGARLIKATNTEDLTASIVNNQIDSLKKLNTWSSFLPLLVRGGFEFSSMIITCGILIYSYSALDIQAANMLVVLGILVRLIPRLNALQQNIHTLAVYVPAFQNALEMIGSSSVGSEHPRLNESGKNVELENQMSGQLEINIKSAGYNGIKILHDVKLSIPEKGLVGIVGESGSGKSTFISCIMGLADIYQGSMSFPGRIFEQDSLGDWRRCIGYVPQEITLFHASVFENIAWGLKNCKREQVEAASKKAFAHEFIMELTDGYDTIIGDQGIMLSGGQRQRLGIARALLRNPVLMLMDEATSALDSRSEENILKVMAQIRQEICVVMVAHRLSTVKDSDFIVVMDNGTITETGGWQELLRESSSFQALVAAQSTRVDKG